MKRLGWVTVFIFCIVGCTPTGEKMTLLENKIDKVKLSSFENYGGINEEYVLSFNRKEDIEIFERAIKTAVKMPSAHMNAEPNYDMLVEYVSVEGELPTHGIHMWAKENVEFMYIGDDDIYAATPEMSAEILELLK